MTTAMPDQKHKPPILFLDIDGVMNTTTGGSCEAFTRRAVENLREIVAATGCAVVISSSWRENKMERLHDVFKAHGLGAVREKIIGSTPLLDSADLPAREDEIGCWLHANGLPPAMAILDDEPFTGTLKRWLVQTSCETGLTEAHARRAIALLNKR